ncbi:iron(III) transport system substrate-binding protein [Facklamia miroungae]|uniref:Iron(III) transport system substrate-binding protein n=2 Tax=Facklamia miroungae TaxID=120956 RepID=A0A1G7V670_9LACT|nr:iron(III) transport system substrate-binding protein [Facklamia miroungae]
MPNPLYSGAAAYNLGIFTRHDDFGWDFYTGIKAISPEVVKGNGAVMEAVSSGQKAYGMIVDYLAIRAKNEGNPVDFVYPEEGVPVITEPIAITKDTEEIEIAQSFVDFVLSEDGQKLQSELGYSPIREGLQAPEGLKSADDLENVLTADMKELLKGREDDKTKFDEIFSAQ